MADTQGNLFASEIPQWAGGSPSAAARAGAEGEARKRSGMARAASAKNKELAYARQVARCMAENRGEITADDVAQALGEERHAALGNACGSIFVGDEWEFTGRLVKSKRTKANANLLRVWRLKT